MKTGLSTSTAVQAITTRQSLHTVTGLDSNTAYTFRISARNTLGVVNSSDYKVLTTPAGIDFNYEHYPNVIGDAS